MDAHGLVDGLRMDMGVGLRICCSPPHAMRSQGSMFKKTLRKPVEGSMDEGEGSAAGTPLASEEPRRAGVHGARLPSLAAAATTNPFDEAEMDAAEAAATSAKDAQRSANPFEPPDNLRADLHAKDAQRSSNAQRSFESPDKVAQVPRSTPGNGGGGSRGGHNPFDTTAGIPTVPVPAASFTPSAPAAPSTPSASANPPVHGSVPAPAKAVIVTRVVKSEKRSAGRHNPFNDSPADADVAAATKGREAGGVAAADRDRDREIAALREELSHARDQLGRAQREARLALMQAREAETRAEADGHALLASEARERERLGRALAVAQGERDAAHAEADNSSTALAEAEAALAHAQVLPRTLLCHASNTVFLPGSKLLRAYAYHLLPILRHRQRAVLCARSSMRRSSNVQEAANAAVMATALRQRSKRQRRRRRQQRQPRQQPRPADCAPRPQVHCDNSRRQRRARPKPTTRSRHCEMRSMSCEASCRRRRPMAWQRRQTQWRPRRQAEAAEVPMRRRMSSLHC